MLVIWADCAVVSLEVTEDPLANVVDIDCALPEVTVGNPTHCFEEGLHHGVETKLGVLFPLFDSLTDFSQEAGVFKNKAVSFKDQSFIIRAGDALNVLLQLAQLFLGLGDSEVKASLLGWNIFFLDGIDIRSSEPSCHDMDRSESNSTGHRSAVESVFAI